MKDMKNRVIVMIMAAVFALPAMAGWIKQEQQNATEQQSAFQSTSAMQGSGSPYSSTPIELNDKGIATYEDTTEPEPAYIVRGPRKVGSMPGMPDTKDTKDNTPIGDAVLPMMLMAAAAAGAVAWRRRKAVVDAELGK